MTPEQGAAKLQKMAAAIPQEIKSAINKTTQTGVRLGRANSSGLFSLAQLAALHHPYSIRHPQSAFDPMLINVQSGAFRSAWKRIAAAHSSGGYIGHITNSSAEAAYLIDPRGPGARMVRRRVDILTLIDVEPFLWKNVLAGIQKALKI